MGLVEPAASEDHRETSVTLTDEGRDIVRRGAPLWDKAQDEIEARLGDDGVEQLQSLLRAIS